LDHKGLHELVNIDLDLQWKTMSHKQNHEEWELTFMDDRSCTTTKDAEAK